MGIILKLYGDLREKGSPLDNNLGIPCTLNLKLNNIGTVFDILKKYKIELNEISHIFVNGKYSSPSIEVKEGDRIGLFPKRMSLIFLEMTITE